MAFRRGDDTDEAMAGAVFASEFISMITHYLSH